MPIITKIKTVVGLLIKLILNQLKFEDLLIGILNNNDDFLKKKIT